jgi:hypothetical protein
MSWLVASLVLSIVLTVVLNLAPRAFPRASERATRRVDDGGAAQPSGVRVYFPWKAMLIGSVVLTIVVNVLARL